MKKIFVFILVMMVQLSFSVEITDTQKLTATCKVWGFLKYYHPKVANGGFNWNSQLEELLHKIEKVHTAEEFSPIIENWIDSLGEVDKIKDIPKEVNYFDKNFDLGWIQSNNLFSENLSSKLKYIENNRYQGNQYYVQTYQAGNIFPTNENFEKLDYSDKNSRILVLFMYWNMIEYFYPYKYLMDQTWDQTLKEMIPLFIEAQNEKDFYIAMQKLTVKLNDSHGVFYLYPKKSLNFFPGKGKVIDDKIIITEILADSLAKADNIKVGDIITKINDRTISDIIAEKKDLIYGSNKAAFLNNIVKPLLSDTSSTVKLEIFSNGKYTTKILKWYNYHDSHRNEYVKGVKKNKFEILEDNIGYVDMGTLKVNNVPDMIAKLQSTKAIIFDLRNYPNGTFRDISLFLNAEEKEFAIYTVPDLSYPGRFKWIEGTKCGSVSKKNYKGNVVILMNEDSMSQAEWTAMCFQTAGNTKIIGSQTAGADGNVTEFDLIKAFFTRFSGIGVYYPNKRETQRVGIIPDIKVQPTIGGIQEGKDEVLERALLYVKTGK